MELIITTYNTLLSCSDGCFKVSNDGKEQKVAVKDVSAIHLSRGVQVTTDASMLAIENEIPVFFIEHSGKPVGVFGVPIMVPFRQLEKVNCFSVSRCTQRIGLRSNLLRKLAINRPCCLCCLLKNQQRPMTLGLMLPSTWLVKS